MDQGTDGRFWVGTTEQGNTFVLDRSAQVDGGVVYLFSRTRAEFRGYTECEVRDHLIRLRGSLAEDLIKRYLEWREVNPGNPAKLASQASTNRAKAERAGEQARIDKLVEDHRRHMRGVGREYQGYLPTTLAGGHRSTHCWNCKRGLDSGHNIACGACKWLICSCGACRCGSPF